MKKLVIVFSLLLICSAAGNLWADDSVLHLGPTGYAVLPGASVPVSADLDYTKNFSVEAVVNIEPHKAGGRWSDLIAKTDAVPDASSGFAIGFNQGHFETLGQQIYAKVADGTNAAVTGSWKYPYYAGMTYVVITWDVVTKTINLYVNGLLADTQSNPLVNPSNIRNTKASLQMGQLGSKTFGRDILLARLWNRELSGAEVSSLYNSFNTTGSHAVPADVLRTDLRSEWLMQETSDASGGAGTTYIKDTAGSNHLQLMGGAVLNEGNGLLSAAYPANGAYDVSPAVTFKASGGRMTLINAVGALSYFFQVDESSSFNSADLKESGWISSLAQWKPVLKPGNIYYWHVKVKDSASNPVISAYTQTQSFTTRAGKDWFVRPGVYTGRLDDYIPIPVPGTYGTQDGTSYANAWNGIKEIVWGEDGVAAGDNVYVCGSHLYRSGTSGNFDIQQAYEYIKESGYSSEYSIIIRMDYPGDPGVMWGYFDNHFSGGSIWQGPDANGVYASQNSFNGPIIQDIKGSGGILLDKESAPTWQNHPGAWYFDSTSKTMYVKLTDSGPPQERIFFPGYGFRFDLGRSSFITFKNCRFYGSTVGRDGLLRTKTNIPVSHHITFDGCNLKYGVSIGLTKGNDYWVVRHCEISQMPYGIYVSLDKDLGEENTTSANYLLVEYNEIHHTSTDNFPNGDGHAIGVQGGQGDIFQHNTIHDINGSAIEFWTYNQPMKDMTVRYNFIKDVYLTPHTGTSGGGIVVSGDAASVPGLRTGYKIHHNIIMNTGINAWEAWQGGGISGNNVDPMEIYNNILVNTRSGIGLHPNNYPATGFVYNNIVMYPKEGKSYINAGNTGPHTVKIDNNLFYPATSLNTPNAFSFYPPLSYPHDEHSVFADPQFVSVNPQNAEDFRLKPTSPAINAGFNVGLDKDFMGTAIPQGGTPDIGAFEYTTFLLGDVSGDGNVSAYDAALAAKYAVGLITLTPEQITRSDVSGGGGVSAYDAALIAQKAVGLITKFPAEG